MVNKKENYNFKLYNSLSIKENVRIAIWNAILNGKLAPGERILESRIAKQMNISRAPVREAVRQLEGEGLVTVVPRKGVFIAELTVDDIEELYFLRSEIEGLAVRFFLKNRKDEEIEELKELVERMKLAIKEKNIEKLSKIDVSFHELIVSASRYKRLYKVWLTLKPHIWTLNNMVRIEEIDLEEVVDLHSSLIKDLESNDRLKAEKSIKSHIKHFGKRLLKSLKDNKKNNK
ncbi:MAG: GntR family transcriptional regulator [Candidatus Humimicrobiaceae bacterium]